MSNCLNLHLYMQWWPQIFLYWEQTSCKQILNWSSIIHFRSETSPSDEYLITTTSKLYLPGLSWDKIEWKNSPQEELKSDNKSLENMLNLWWKTKIIWTMECSGSMIPIRYYKWICTANISFEMLSPRRRFVCFMTARCLDSEWGSSWRFSSFQHDKNL